MNYMTKRIDKTYKTEKLLEWERKSLIDKFSIFSFSKKLTWLTLGKIILGLCFIGFIVPFIPPRFGWDNWTPATTNDEYQYRLTNFWVEVPIMIIVISAYVNIRRKIDILRGSKRTANFKVTEVLNLVVIKILIMNGWRLFSIKANQPYFNSVKQGQIITIKRSWTYKP